MKLEDLINEVSDLSSQIQSITTDLECAETVETLSDFVTNLELAQEALDKLSADATDLLAKAKASSEKENEEDDG